MPITLVFPVAGEGMRFKSQGWKVPKPLIEIAGQPMISRVVYSFESAIQNKQINQIVFISKEDILTKLRTLFDHLEKKYKVPIYYLVAEKPTQGAACSVLLSRNIIQNRRILIADCDTAYSPNRINEFFNYLELSSCDLAVSCFISQDERFSFIDNTSIPTRIAEKKAISNCALSGLYYFKNSTNFIETTIDSMIYNDRDKGEFYISKIMGNASIKKSIKVSTFLFDTSDIYFYGTPEQLILENQKLEINSIN